MRPPAHPEAATLRVRVQPRASREGIAGFRQDVLTVRVSAPPVDGAANAAVTLLLAEALGVARAAVRVVRGERARDKVVRIDGLTDAQARARLEGGRTQ
jgi:uncharacterized protein (TIGR00251 family)